MRKNRKIYLFDVDNTLYCKDTNLFKAVDTRINLFLKKELNIPEEKVNSVRKEYFHKYGTTLNGLMKHFKVDPIYYLEYVHNVPLEKHLTKNEKLIKILSKLDGEKVIFSNAYTPYILKILKLLGIENFFSEIIDIVKTGFNPKPLKEPYKFIISQFNKKNKFIMIDDSEKNLNTGKLFGFTTVLIGKQANDFDFSFEKIELIEKIVDF